jgi:uncharacterized protein YecT (DUF1311 family)
MALVKKKTQITAALFIYLASLGLAQANEIQCMDRAKDVARKTFGSCLAEQKTQELQEMQKSYQKALVEMKQKHEQDMALVKAERAELRKGIIKAKNTDSSSLNSSSNLENKNSSDSTLLE